MLSTPPGLTGPPTRSCGWQASAVDDDDEHDDPVLRYRTA